MKNRHAFTLVELMVVVTIIVLLLALLMPAMNKAIYRAQLVQCAANQKAVVVGMLDYTLGSNRNYPYRGLPEKNLQFYIAPQVLTHQTEGANGPGTYDIRPPLASFININRNLNDPFVQPVNLEWKLPSGALDTYILSSYHLWHGWKYTGAGFRGMYKVGDNWTLGSRRHNLLMSDMDFRWMNGGPVASSSHPDFKRLFNNIGDHAPSPITGGFITVSTWEFFNGDGIRNPLDLNFAYDDASVTQVNQVEYDDPRMERVGVQNDTPYGHSSTQIPKR